MGNRNEKRSRSLSRRRAEAGSIWMRTSPKGTPSSGSTSLGTAAILPCRLLDAQRGRQGVVEDDDEEDTRGPRRSEPITAALGVGKLHASSTRKQSGEWHGCGVLSGRAAGTMRCNGSTPPT
jgi:hypothetical protein